MIQRRVGDTHPADLNDVAAVLPSLKISRTVPPMAFISGIVAIVGYAINNHMNMVSQAEKQAALTVEVKAMGAKVDTLVSTLHASQTDSNVIKYQLGDLTRRLSDVEQKISRGK